MLRIWKEIRTQHVEPDNANLWSDQMFYNSFDPESLMEN